MALVRDEIDANPEAPEPYLHLADVHAIAGRNADAIEAVGLALEQNPNLSAAYLRLGELWLEEATLGATDKAVAALESVVKMDPANGHAALTLGQAYLAMDDEASGFAELKRATQATPIPAEAHRLLGDLYRTRKKPRGGGDGVSRISEVARRYAGCARAGSETPTSSSTTLVWPRRPI